jgi:hypothetical protein
MTKPFRLLVTVAVVAAAVATSLVVPARAQKPSAAKRPVAKSLLLNADFEKGLAEHPWMPTAWDTSIADLPTVFFGRDSFLVHRGQWAVNVANMSAAWPLGHNWSQTILVGPETWGKRARLKVWARNNGVDGRAYLLLQAYRDTVTRMARIWGVDRTEALRRLDIAKIDDPLLDLGWKRTQFSEPLTEWVEREASIFVAPGTNVLFVRCGLIGTGQVFFDDASLTLEPAVPVRYAPETNLFADAGFEQGGLDWDRALPPYEGSRVFTDTTVAHSGRASGCMADFSDGIVTTKIGLSQPFDGRALRGKRVRLTGWFKGDSLKSTCLVKVFSHGLKSGVRQSGAGEMLSGTWDWQPLSVEFDVADDAELVWAHLYTTAPAVGRVWVDDADFRIVSTATAPPARKKP